MFTARNSPLRVNHVRRATLKDLFLLMVGRRRRVRVEGRSMLPTLQIGDHLIVDPRAYRSCAPRAGEVVIARHPLEERELVKRVERVEAAGLWLASDNPAEGNDSRHFGAIAPDSILGKVVARVGPAN